MSREQRNREKLHITPSMAAIVSAAIREVLEASVLWAAPKEPPRAGDLQRMLPFGGSTRHLPLGSFPMEPFELVRAFCAEGGVRPMGGNRATPSGELVLACSKLVRDDIGLIPIIFVRQEHMDDDEVLDGAGRFGALRELARLIWARKARRDPLKSFAPWDVTAEMHPGHFQDPRVFDDPLTRWAMELGCPPIELRRLVQALWAAVPVKARSVENVGPILVSGNADRDRLFLGMKHNGRGLEQVFGLSPHAVLAWCRHLGLIEWRP